MKIFSVFIWLDDSERSDGGKECEGTVSAGTW